MVTKDKPRLKKKNPQDSTTRNTRAANERLCALEARFKILESEVGMLLVEQFDRHEKEVQKLKKKPKTSKRRK